MKAATRNLLAVSSLAVALSGSGCAFGTRTAQLTYPPPAANSKKAAESSSPANSKGKVIVQAIEDKRADKKVVGHVRNGFGMKTADVVSGTDPAVFVASALRTELQKDGWEVLSSSAAGDAKGVPRITGDVLVFYCDAYMSYDGNVTLCLKVHKDGAPVFDKTYQGKGSSVNWAATGAGYGETLSVALQDALKAFKADLPGAAK